MTMAKNQLISTAGPLSVRVVKGLTVSILAIFLLACGGGSTESMLASARDYMAKKDAKAAIIQIKNALQKDPNSPDARYLMGAALLETGEMAAAEVELKKALDLKASADDVVPKLAEALLGTGQFKRLTDEYSATPLGSAKANASLKTSLASAWAAQGKSEQFQEALKAALAAEPGHEPAILAQARFKAGIRDFDAALELAESVLLKNPKSAEALRLKGDLMLYFKQQPDDALAQYRKAIEAKADLLPAHAGAVNILLTKNKLDDASTQLDALKKVLPNHPQTRYLVAQLAYQKKDFKTAREQVQQLLRIAPNNVRAIQLAGAVEFQLNSLLQAEVLLNKALAASPELVLARRMLVMTYLRSGQPAKALTTLNAGIAKGVVDPEINTVAGEVYLQNGDVKKAEEYFAKAAKASPDDARKKTSLALSRLAGSNSEAAYGELQEIAAADKGVTADMALISAHLRKGDFDKALKAIDGLEKKQPEKPLAANLRGRTLLAKKDTAGARKSFEAALKIDPTFFTAVASLAALDLAEKKPEDAKKRFEAVLAKEPKNGQALLALAELAARTGAPKEEVGALLIKATEANPTEPGPRLLLVDFYLGNNDVKQATSAAQNAVATLPENPDVIDALGRVQLAAGEPNQAVTTFSKVVALQPLSPRPLLRLADGHMANKNKDAALQTLKKAIEIKPDLIDAQKGVISLNMDAKRYSEAVAMAKTVQKQRPKEPVGYVFEGDISASQKNWDAATLVYRAGLKEAPSAELAIKLHSSLLTAKKIPDADKFAATWVKDNPNDFGFQFYLGDYAIARRDYASAEKSYNAVIKLQPTNAAAFNNLAWVSGRLNKSNAVELAEKALQLAPQQAPFMDTLAVLLSDKGDYAKALEWQNKAITAQPQNTLFKLNLAKIHIKGDKKDLAKKELDGLAKLGDKFPNQAEVGTLLKSL